MDYIYIKFIFDCGYYTDDDEQYVKYKRPVSNDVIQQDGHERFLEFCQDYEHLIMADYTEDDGDYSKYYQDYIDDYCSWSYEEVTREEYEANG